MTEASIRQADRQAQKHQAVRAKGAGKSQSPGNRQEAKNGQRKLTGTKAEYERRSGSKQV